MMKKCKRSVTLYRPETYQIKVLGQLDKNWAEWDGNMNVTVENEENEHPVTTLTGTVDQAALQGLLRRLHSLGLPLLSLICVECGTDDALVTNQR